jgi:hypothetical protein
LKLRGPCAKSSSRSLLVATHFPTSPWRRCKAVQTHSFEGFSDPELSIFRFAHKAAVNPKSLRKEDYQWLQTLGLSKATILEILGAVWANTAMNMIVDALGVMRTAQQEEELRIG